MLKKTHKNYYENLLSLYHSFKTPSNWKCTNLINVCEFIHRGKTPTYSLIKKIPVLAQKCNQKNGIITLDNSLYLEPDIIDKFDESKRIRVNDIIINSTGGGTVGRVGFIDENLFNNFKIIVADSHITIVRPFNLVASKYIYYYLKAPIIFDHVEEKCEGSTNQIELYAKVIMEYPFPLPPAREQQRIVSKIDKIFKQSIFHQ